jgi:hypothetical protein
MATMRHPFKHYGVLDAPISVEHGNTYRDEKPTDNANPTGIFTIYSNSNNSDSEKLDADAQNGVRKIQATTTVWTKNHLLAAYILMWCVTFVDALQQGTTGVLTPFVTSDFKQHSLTAYTSVMAGIFGGILKLPLAKVLDIFGRPHGFALATFFLIIGLVMMAACNGVQTYSAAQIFYWVG